MFTELYGERLLFAAVKLPDTVPSDKILSSYTLRFKKGKKEKRKEANPGTKYRSLCSMKYLQETCLVKLTSGLIGGKA